MSESEKKKRRVIKEDIKDIHTSHWDLDYLSREELEKLMTQSKDQAGDKMNSKPADSAGGAGKPASPPDD